MRTDRFDKMLWASLLFTAACLVWLLLTAGAARVDSGDSALERELAARARIELVEKLYAPVSELLEQNREQQALLKLEGLLKRYPGEAHGFVLKAEILWRMGAREEALASMVEGVRRKGDYLEQESSLSRRPVVTAMVEQGQPYFAERLHLDAQNGAAEMALKNVYYLQSRLAGGCE